MNGGDEARASIKGDAKLTPRVEKRRAQEAQDHLFRAQSIVRAHGLAMPTRIDAIAHVAAALTLLTEDLL